MDKKFVRQAPVHAVFTSAEKLSQFLVQAPSSPKEQAGPVRQALDQAERGPVQSLKKEEEPSSFGHTPSRTPPPPLITQVPVLPLLSTRRRVVRDVINQKGREDVRRTRFVKVPLPEEEGVGGVEPTVQIVDVPEEEGTEGGEEG